MIDTLTAWLRVVSWGDRGDCPHWAWWFNPLCALCQLTGKSYPYTTPSWFLGSSDCSSICNFYFLSKCPRGASLVHPLSGSPALTSSLGSVSLAFPINHQQLDLFHAPRSLLPCSLDCVFLCLFSSCSSAGPVQNKRAFIFYSLDLTILQIEPSITLAIMVGKAAGREGDIEH
jgi:hypothetical protein